jgi:hypothetical protein
MYKRVLKLIGHPAVREPLDKIDITHRTFDAWEILLYFMALSFTLEGKRKTPTLI